VTQTAAITADSLTLLGAGGSYTLTDAGNRIGALAAITGTINVTDSTDLSLAGLNVGMAVITDSGKVTQTAAITADSLTLLGAGGSYTLTAERSRVGARGGTSGAADRDETTAVGVTGRTGRRVGVSGREQWHG